MGSSLFCVRIANTGESPSWIRADKALAWRAGAT